MEEKKSLSTEALQKCKLLVTVVDRRKAEFYLDYLEEFRIHMQTVIPAEGTARTEMLELLGLRDSEKAVLLSVIREDCVKEAMNGLSVKFETVRGGKGIAFVIPLSGVMGVSLYRLLSDQMQSRGIV